MSLWFISRHGEAEAEAVNDVERRLTERGKTEITALWQRLKNHRDLELPTAIVASPYVRAQETANLIADVLGVKSIQTSEEIVPDGSVSQVLEQLQNLQSTNENILVVSHMPLVGYLYSQWCQGIGAPAASFQAGQVVALKGEPVLGGAKPLWKQTP